jgi:hypothetical protein
LSHERSDIAGAEGFHSLSKACGSGDLVAARNGGLETAELGEMAELEDMK